MLRVVDVLADHHRDSVHADVIYGSALQVQVINVRPALRTECYAFCLEAEY
jgi:hypothetical protein